jgi:asparagine synthase (glutamine-hydrolysing)
MPLPIQKALPKTVSMFARGVKGSLRYKLNRTANVFETAHLPFSERMANKQSYLPIPMVKELTRNLKGITGIEEYYNGITSKIPYRDEFYRLMYLNFKHDLPDDYLVKVDRMSMANSLESRAPFLDYRLIEFMAKVDKNVKMQGWERKSVLRKTAGRQLPKRLLKAPKRGFGVPLREWFKDGYNSRISLGNIRGVLDNHSIEKIIRDNSSGARDNGNFIWTLMMLDAYLD